MLAGCGKACMCWWQELPWQLSQQKLGPCQLAGSLSPSSRTETYKTVLVFSSTSTTGRPWGCCVAAVRVVSCSKQAKGEANGAMDVNQGGLGALGRVAYTRTESCLTCCVWKRLWSCGWLQVMCAATQRCMFLPGWPPVVLMWGAQKRRKLAADWRVRRRGCWCLLAEGPC